MTADISVLPRHNNFPERHQDYPRIAVIGAGRWGKNLIRNFNHLQHLTTICDLNAEQLAPLAETYPEIKLTSDIDEVLSSPDIDAVVIATPGHTHKAVAEKALTNGKHVYVEKPMATNTEDCQALFKAADQYDKVLMVGHLLMYHPVVIRLKQLIEAGELGDITFIQSDRLNFNPFRQDKNVLWDLAPHDLSMMCFLLSAEPEHIVSVSGHKTGSDGLVDIAHLSVGFPNGVVGHVHNSWIHPYKQVKLIVRGSKKTAVLDDTLEEGKLQLFSSQNNGQGNEKLVEKPDYLTIEPLKMECQHFINAVKDNRRPKTDGINGYAVVKILELAERELDK